MLGNLTASFETQGQNQVQDQVQKFLLLAQQRVIEGIQETSVSKQYREKYYINEVMQNKSLIDLFNNKKDDISKVSKKEIEDLALANKWNVKEACFYIAAFNAAKKQGFLYLNHETAVLQSIRYNNYPQPKITYTDSQIDELKSASEHLLETINSFNEKYTKLFEEAIKNGETTKQNLNTNDTNNKEAGEEKDKFKDLQNECTRELKKILLESKERLLNSKQVFDSFYQLLEIVSSNAIIQPYASRKIIAGYPASSHPENLQGLFEVCTRTNFVTIEETVPDLKLTELYELYKKTYQSGVAERMKHDDYVENEEEEKSSNNFTIAHVTENGDLKILNAGENSVFIIVKDKNNQKHTIEVTNPDKNNAIYISGNTNTEPDVIELSPNTASAKAINETLKKLGIEEDINQLIKKEEAEVIVTNSLFELRHKAEIAELIEGKKQKNIPLTDYEKELDKSYAKERYTLSNHRHLLADFIITPNGTVEEVKPDIPEKPQNPLLLSPKEQSKWLSESQSSHPIEAMVIKPGTACVMINSLFGDTFRSEQNAALEEVRKNLTQLKDVNLGTSSILNLAQEQEQSVASPEVPKEPMPPMPPIKPEAKEQNPSTLKSDQCNTR